MNYQQAEDYIFSYTDYEKTPMPHDPAFYDLRRVEELLARLGNPHLAAKSVHIAGTKGKGSVAAMVASALSLAGYTTGLYTSPHLHTWRERMRVGGELISEEEFVALVGRLKPEVEAVNRKATYGQLTTFELLTALGFAFFKLKGAEFQVLEVGMGGTFDATNVITPEVCIITSIS
ncbi:MAG: bifunctional folylpolyglutamate synthase/dihydrofolate synthase, partial [Gammaproteobacteria bacterium]|nr:bifunctional folylpolyglutamate synthase/dihydrofolate synthase [Gammaproteobacteria bacterium]